MKCIVGLGNPGNRYRNTRHNIGFRAIESLVSAFNAKHLESTHLYECYQSSIPEFNTLLVIPLTFMNNSGFAIKEIHTKYEIPIERFLVAFDDFQLPFGTLRTRPKGSDGGHNGLASAIYHLQSDLLPRLRIGIAGKSIPKEHTHETMADYVLSPFEKDEEKLIPELLRHIEETCKCWIQFDIQKTMSLYNKNFFNSANAE